MRESVEFRFGEKRKWERCCGIYVTKEVSASFCDVSLHLTADMRIKISGC